MRSLGLTISLCLLAMASAAVEPYEHFVLVDGRKLVGTHDPVRQRLYLAGPILASVHVATEAIVSRRPATNDEVPAAAAPTDPTAARIARLRASIHGYDKAAQARALDRIALERRLAEAAAVLADLHQRFEALAAEAAALQPERQRVQFMVDEVEQARALTELRVVALTATIVGEERPTVVATTISELTTELTVARTRIADLSRQLSAIDVVLAQRRAVMADLQTRALRQRKESDELERRLARYHVADADGVARRERLAVVLAQVLDAGEAEAVAEP